MRKWKGKPGSASLPADVEEALRQRSRNVLGRRGVSDEVIGKVVSALFDEVSWAYAGRKHKLAAEGRGFPRAGQVHGNECRLGSRVGQGRGISETH